MTSIFENTNSKVIIHILHDNTLTEDNRKKFIRTAEKYSQGINLVDVTQYRKLLGEDLAGLYRPGLTIGTLYRLLTWEVLPDIEKVIYLDCDVFVNLDISELWEIDVHDKCLAGSIDGCFHNASRFSSIALQCKLMGCNKLTYICAGVLVMNLKKIREHENFLQDAIDWLRWHPHLAGSADQDIFNSLLYGEIKIIDGKFDCQGVEYSAEESAGKIIHAGGTVKLWSTIINPEISALYWKTYLKSAWGENCSIEEIINRMCTIAVNPEFCHTKSKQCIKRIKERITLKLNRRFFGIITMLAQDIYYRIKYKLSR